MISRRKLFGAAAIAPLAIPLAMKEGITPEPEAVITLPPTHIGQFIQIANASARPIKIYPQTSVLYVKD